MRANNIQQHCNDVQYHDNTKDGISMNERTFILFVKSIIKEYGEIDGNSIYISLDFLPPILQQEYLKQWMFFEGYIEYYQEIFSDPIKIHSAIQENKDDLNYWLKQYSDEIAQEFFEAHVYDNDLRVCHYIDNNEFYLARR